MTAAFAPIDEALARAEEKGRRIAFWWRDDDAVSASPAIDRLMVLSSRYRVPLALAVIPDLLAPSLAPALADKVDVSVLVHGFRHANHAPPGTKKAEFGAHRPLAAMTDEAKRALSVLRAAFGQKLVPVFVPPWNRIGPELVPVLATLGFEGLSTFGERKAREAAPGLIAINTHIDPIDWHGGRSLVDPHALSEKLAEAMLLRARGETAEPVGLLTHHLVHDEAIWAFCETLLAHLARSRAVCFHDLSSLLRKEREPQSR